MPTDRRPHVLLRSSWQVLNIGDVAHTPGVLTLLERYIPEAEVALWASPGMTDAVKRMERRRFPNLKIVTGTIDASGHASTPELGDAVAWADFLLHGSGPSLLAYDDVVAFTRVTGKPFGVYGITFGWHEKHDLRVYDRAAFIFFRDGVSLDRARAAGVKCPIMEWGPDGAFAVDLEDDAGGTAFMRNKGLVAGQFLCCIPRARITPYWLPAMQNRPMTDADRAADAENQRFEEHDHAPLRAAIAAVVDHPDVKVLICPEGADQVALGKTAILDKLPHHVRSRVVWQDRFWLTDEAISVYRRSLGVFGHEMHSPIMCVGNGIPAIVCRWERQTSKGFMWRDIGLGDWLFDMDDPASVRGLAPAVASLVTNAAGARLRTATAQRWVRQRFSQTMALVRDSVFRSVRPGERRLTL